MTSTLLGGIGLTHLTVYHDPPGPDGVRGGCAHIHAITPEAYFGIAGSGAIELHDLENGFRRQEIRKGTFVQFPPGTLHRSVSTDNLEVVAVMGNGGLAERGDARIYFGRETDETPGAYERQRALADTGVSGAIARRDASASAYAELMQLWHQDRESYFAELRRFYRVHCQSVAARSQVFRDAIDAGPVAAGNQALGRLAVLASGDVTPDIRSAVADTANDADVLGMCGRLRPVANPSAIFFGASEEWS